MHKLFRRIVSAFLSAAMLASTAVHAGAGQQALPAQVSYTLSSNSYSGAIGLDFGQDAADWIRAIHQVTVNGTPYNNAGNSFFPTKPYWKAGTSLPGAYASYAGVELSGIDASPAAVAISASGYPTLTVTLTKADGSYTAELANEAGGQPAPQPDKEVTLEKVRITDDGGILPAYHWHFSFGDAPEYIAAVKTVQVNGVGWERKTYAPSVGGAYYPNRAENRLEFALQSFASGKADVLKSGDVIRITADGYPDLEFKFVLDKAGKNPKAVAEDGNGDPYALHVKLMGAFEAAMSGQKKYDGVSGATGSIAANKNSDVTVYGALTEKDKAPTQDDWKALDNGTSDIQLAGSKCFVTIEPDTAHGTPAGNDSGMQGVYLSVSSALTLSGTPKDPGRYLISVSITDDQGRTAKSNALPFQIYSGEETLADQLRTEHLVQTQDGKHMWKIMEPWAIKNFGSNVVGEQNSVRVPKTVKAWYGSHTSGTYGYLGYDLPWQDVLDGRIPQTLYIPDGCSLTLVNMGVLSSVRIVVERGGKLTLRDSVVQGRIDVQSGGVFSMNYSGFGSKSKFLVGASLCGQLCLQDGAVLENAAIYSHTNYLANGKLADRTSSAPVVTATLPGQLGEAIVAIPVKADARPARGRGTEPNRAGCGARYRTDHIQRL